MYSAPSVAIKATVATFALSWATTSGGISSRIWGKSSVKGYARWQNNFCFPATHGSAAFEPFCLLPSLLLAIKPQ